jgi:transposase InsO family protein
MQVPNIGRALYFVLFKDNITRYRVIECLKSKPDALPTFKQFLAQLKRETCSWIKIPQSNRGTEFTNDEFWAFLEHEGIKQELTAAYTPEKNGGCENDNSQNHGIHKQLAYLVLEQGSYDYSVCAQPHKDTYFGRYDFFRGLV